VTIFPHARRVKADENTFEREELAEGQKCAVAAIQIECQNLMLKHKWEIDCLLQCGQMNDDHSRDRRGGFTDDVEMELPAPTSWDDCDF
jgi:hypothetical protein